jgi:osmoprotectant transport system ATP-binding protein
LSDKDRASEAMIRLEKIMKRFPGQSEPAVKELTMEIPEGEIVVLVGPSGCGKTTTMKMINRLIEPTSGEIFLEGENVTNVNGDELRRRIGYVIQQIGLFPHMTIAANIGLVPRMLGWEKQRISRRVDELLEMVGLDPATYRDRYPKQLSGGQRQRIGVARAMAADPPVMLMDEPFGAIDPITRDRLQNEFLRLQTEIRKTIVFVTHDIDEAIKMGDRIAILREDSRIAQYDAPERILTNPADDFVENFIGSGASLKALSLARVSEVAFADWPVAEAGTDRQALREMVLNSNRGSVLLLDERRRPARWLTVRDVDGAGSLDEVGVRATSTVEPSATLHDALDLMVVSYSGAVAVVDDAGAYQGIVELDAIRARIDEIRAAAQERYRGEQGVVTAPTGEEVTP